MEKEYAEPVRAYIENEISVLQALDKESICQAIAVIDEARLQEKNIFIFGNGGSSATASHFANDFNRGLSEALDVKFRFHCLNDNVATLMAIANDFSFDEVFRAQLEGRVTKGDLVIAISGSGNSENVVRAARYAKEQGATLLALTGYDGGKLYKLADVNLHAPVMSMQITEDIHMIFDHLMMSVLYKVLCGRDHLMK